MDRSISRIGAALVAALLIAAMSAAPALACGGLIGPNGAVNLLRTTTLAAYHDGAEHYVTAFQFAGGGGAFGSLTPRVRSAALASLVPRAESPLEAVEGLLEDPALAAAHHRRAEPR